MIQRYLDAVDAELRPLDRPAISTLFIGGGTPTHLSHGQLDRFLKQLAARFELSAGIEWTVEANPEDITTDKLQLLVDHGVNRISLGVQSFNAKKLVTLERSHDADAVQGIVQKVAGYIANVSIDLIFAAPGETLTEWEQDLRTALSLPITHLSTYALTFEKGTSFWTRRRSGELEPATEQAEVDMYLATRTATAKVGLEQYEVSSFARAGSRCRHNLAYWRGQGWYAAGPGAASFVDGHRKMNHRSTTTYLRRMERGDDPIFESESEVLSQLEYACERMAFGLRMIDGVRVGDLSKETGIDLAAYFADELSQLTSDGLIAESADRVCLTERGILYADTVAAAFLDRMSR